jgi:signal transduction histidine kinase
MTTRPTAELRRPPPTLKGLLLAHAIGYIALITLTALIGSAGFYYWKQASAEALRLNVLVEDAQAMRGTLYRQTKEVFDAVLLGDADAAAQYLEYGLQVQGRLDALRSKAAGEHERQAIARLDASYNAIRRRIDDITGNWHRYSAPQRLEVLDTEFEKGSLRRYEEAFGDIEAMLSSQQARVQSRLEKVSRVSLLVLALPLMAALALLYGSRYLLRRALVEPILAVEQAATRISRGQLSHQVPETGARELVELAQSINRMAADMSESRQSLVQAEKQAALAALVPVVAHNIRNPLASIRATAQVLADPALSAELREGLDGIIRTADRLEAWTASLLSYLHPLQARRIPCDARALLDEVLRLLETRLHAASLRVRRQGWDVPREVHVDPQLMEQALHGLLLNAIEASPRNGTIGVVLDDREGQLCIDIEDDGVGPPAPPAGRDLMPGPSTKLSGTGLGIPFAMKVCDIHDGTLSFEERPPHGTRAALRIALNAAEKSRH